MRTAPKTAVKADQKSWWARRGPGARTAIVVALVVAALNLTGALLGTLTGGPARTGPRSSSYSTGPDGLAAMADLLASHGHGVQRLRHPLDEADLGPRAVLVVAEPLDTSPAEHAAARRFVEAGGTLVVTGVGGQPLLDELLGPGAPRWSGDGATPARLIAPVPEVQGVAEVSGTGQGSWAATGAALPVLGDDESVLAAVAALGQGRMVVVADGSVFHNERLGRADNAALALAATASARTVLFAEYTHGYRPPTGVAAIPARWRSAALLVAAAVAVWLWSRAKRFGPPEHPARPLPPPRRAYVQSVAATLARTGDPAGASEPLRGAVRRRLAARSGLAPDASDEDLAAAARRLGMGGAARALDDPRSHEEVRELAAVAARLHGSRR